MFKCTHGGIQCPPGMNCLKAENEVARSFKRYMRKQRINQAHAELHTAFIGLRYWLRQAFKFAVTGR